MEVRHRDTKPTTSLPIFSMSIHTHTRAHTKNFDWNTRIDLEGVSSVDVCLDGASIPQTAARSHGLTSKKRISSWATLRAPVFILKVCLSRYLCFCLSVVMAAFVSDCAVTCICLFVCLFAQYLCSSFSPSWSQSLSFLFSFGKKKKKSTPCALTTEKDELWATMEKHLFVAMHIMLSAHCLLMWSDWIWPVLLCFSLEWHLAKTGDCSISLHVGQTVFSLATLL